MLSAKLRGRGEQEMSRPILRRNDGFEHTTPELRNDVLALQAVLVQRLFPLTVDGLFGSETERAVRTFQEQRGLDVNGIVGPLTWAALGVEAADPEVPPTTLSPTAAWLQAELVEASKYRAFVQEAGQQFGLLTSVIAGIGSRESGWGLSLIPPGSGPAGTGDFTARPTPKPFRSGSRPPDGAGFGRGLMQIDYDAHEFARTGNWKDPRANILYGAQVLRDCRQFIGARASLSASTLLRASLAGFNAGPQSAWTALRLELDIDFFTTGRDYSKDVLNRAGWFQGRGWS
jgi:hypothetical protein